MRAGKGAARYDPVMRASRHIRHGRVTWVTVLIVIGMAMLTGGMVAGLSAKVRAAAAMSTCHNNAKQIALAAINYEMMYGTLPAGTMPNPDLPPDRRLSWFMAIYPYVESSRLYTDTDKTLARDTDRNKPTTHIRIPIFVCPLTPDWDTINTSYVGVAGLGTFAPTVPGSDPLAGVFGYDRGTKLKDITDGPAQTLMILESTFGGPWARGGPGTVWGLEPARPHLGQGRRFGSLHSWQDDFLGPSLVRTYAAMADGSVRVLKEDVSAEVLEALATIHGGETLPPDW
jgi:hypothetical protein